MVSARAYRPDDIITLYNGVTVEVTNTDAEGRLVLGDALAWTCKHIKPTSVVDIATLTGGVVVALGEWCAGLWCGDRSLRSLVRDAGDASGEQVWWMPLWKEHKDFMRARHADIWNSGPKRDGHPIQGAAFLSYFVDEALPWAHIDIAGPATSDTKTDLCVAGPTGFGSRLLTEMAAGLAAKG
jgi:leucyl aminopeptidase